MKHYRSAAKGFTLLEIMVALAILALSLMAALRAGTMSAQNTDEIRQRQLADWVALDRLEEHRARRDWLPIGSGSGEAVQGNQRFRWEEKIGGTPNAQFRRIDIRVLAIDGGDPGHALARVTGFLIKPGG